MAKSYKAPHYTIEDVKARIQFGIANGYISQNNKDQILKRIELYIKNAVVILDLHKANVYR